MYIRAFALFLIDVRSGDGPPFANLSTASEPVQSCTNPCVETDVLIGATGQNLGFSPAIVNGRISAAVPYCFQKLRREPLCALNGNHYSIGFFSAVAG